jgi:hypothetical protein
MLALIAIGGYPVLGGAIVILIFLRTRLKEDLNGIRHELTRANAAKAAANKKTREMEQRCIALVANVQASLTNTHDALTVAKGVEQLVALVSDEPEELPRHAIGQYHHEYENPYPLPEVGTHGHYGR